MPSSEPAEGGGVCLDQQGDPSSLNGGEGDGEPLLQDELDDPPPGL